jgi:hypothetical protein
MKTSHATPLKGTAKKLIQKVSVKPAQGKRSLRAYITGQWKRAKTMVSRCGVSLFSGQNANKNRLSASAGSLQ